MRRKRSNNLAGPERNNSIEKSCRDFIEACKAKNLAEHTIKYHLNGMRLIRRLSDFCDINDVTEITEKRIIDFINYRLECGIKPASINQNLRSWRPYGKFLVANGWLDENPFQGIDNLKVEKLIVETFTNSQLRVLLNTPNQNTFTGFRDYVLMLLFLDTGIRLSEATALKLSDILWSEGRIKVYGKGRKERFVPFQSTLEKNLRKYVSIRSELDHDYLFVSIENEPIKNRTIQDNFRKYGRISKLRNVRCTPHTFRYTFVKKYVMNGADPFSLKAILGHTSMNMVMHYAEMFSKDVSRQHEKFSPLESFMDRNNNEHDDDKK